MNVLSVREHATSSRPEPEEHELGNTVREALGTLQSWIRRREYAGHEPYDLLNSPYLASSWMRRPPLSVLFIQFGKRFGGIHLRRLLRVPPSKNPKALGLLLAAYCDLALCGEEVEAEALYLKAELQRLRSPNESYCCWGYDWDYSSFRGTRMPAFSPNSIASYFCGSALLDMSRIFGDAEAQQMASSVGEFIVTRLNRSIDTPKHLCFSYTPSDHTVIYNSSALAGSFLARLGAATGNPDYLTLARRAMQYLADSQRPNGAWTYGTSRLQQWIDGFHTGYNLLALLDYQEASGDHHFNQILDRGYHYYKRTFFRADGAPKYFHDLVYPIDIHSCSQAILTFTVLSVRDPEARAWAFKVLDWTLKHMRDPQGTFYYQVHRFWINRTPYMRWGQSWMFRALARFREQFFAGR